MNEDDNSILVKIEPTRFNHETVVYVPVFQRNFDEKGNPVRSPNFSYSMSDATHDQQMAASFYPDYILELRGTFDATTKPYTIPSKEENKNE